MSLTHRYLALIQHPLDLHKLLVLLFVLPANERQHAQPIRALRCIKGFFAPDIAQSRVRACYGRLSPASIKICAVSESAMKNPAC